MGRGGSCGHSQHGPWSRASAGQAPWLPLKPVARSKGGRLLFCAVRDCVYKSDRLNSYGAFARAGGRRAMMFTKRLRDGVREGRITSSVRIWKTQRVKPGGIYPMEEGHIVVDSVRPIALEQVTGELARRSGFQGVVDLLKVAKHGSGTNVYLIEFHYVAPSE
jgi:hypothetical protein